MPDLSAPVGALLEVIGPLVGSALRSFFATTAGMVVLTILVVGGGVVICASEGPWAMAAAALLAVVVGCVVGALLALKRAVAAALVAGLKKLQLGRRALGMIFSRLLDVSEDDAMGERGASLAKKAERLPLAVAEARLAGVVNGLVGERAQKKGFRAAIARRIQASALRRVESLTLKQFRGQDAQHGGVDLILVRDELSERVDAMVAGAVQAASRKLTLVAISLVLLLCLGGAFGIKAAFAHAG